ncbi:hypothetical protein [Streptomyces sp. KM273126]|nr:hypothetical protein [Streptomyces sp. KM273126]
MRIKVDAEVRSEDQGEAAFPLPLPLLERDQVGADQGSILAVER